MKQFKLEAAIERLISATNSGDGESLLQSFTEDAVLVDFGRTFRGRSQIAVWDRQENTGTQNVIRVNDVVEGAQVRLKISVSGNGYNGDGVFEIELRDGLISRLNIT
jgi:phenylacetic acid degradation operon negative regulatory protein